MAVERRRLGVTMPSRPGGSLHLSGGGARHQPNYSLNSIVPNPKNPRWKDLLRAGVNLDQVKSVKRKPDESVYEMEARVRSWVDSNDQIPEEYKGFWHRLVSLGVEIHEDGLHQPISIREEKPGTRVAKIVSGERRFLAHWLIGATTIGVLVTGMEDEKASKMALVENFQREEMSLDASVTALREHQEAFGQSFSMAEVGRLLNLSKGSAQGIYHAINAESDDPVFEHLDNGEFTRPYHLKKYFSDRSKAAQEKPSSQAGDRINLTDKEGSQEGEGHDQRKEVARERSNLSDSESGERQSSETNNVEGTRDVVPGRSNLSDASTTFDSDNLSGDPDSSSRDNRTNLSDGTPRKETSFDEGGSAGEFESESPDRSNLSDLHSSSKEWEDVRDFLASITFDYLSLEGADQQTLSDQIESISDSESLESLVVKMAGLYKSRGGQGN